MRIGESTSCTGHLQMTAEGDVVESVHEASVLLVYLVLAVWIVIDGVIVWQFVCLPDCYCCYFLACVAIKAAQQGVV